jgi:vacuolar-type H+-ATPase subunit C/Vma6
MLYDAYSSLVDGGNTEALVQEIQSTSYSEALQTYYELMAQSPNVSEEALIEALKKYELPNVLLTY